MITIWTVTHAMLATIWTWLASFAYTAHVLGTTAGLAAISGAVVLGALVYAITLIRRPSAAQRAGRSWLTADDGADYSRPLGDFTDLDLR
jgi:formate hydrogenlyase subunit 3/multisubunit Na+/H+ antiporter MnhD subunit